MNRILCVALTLFAFTSSFAQDRFFGRTYTSNVLPKGNVDLELWHTSRFGHTGQFFHAMDQRMELEVGLGSNVQTAFYFNRFQKSFSNAAEEIVHASEMGFSNEWKWRVTKPTSSIGTALYGEVGVKGDEVELETKLILDKSFGKNLLAFNLVYELEHEIERENGKTKLELAETPLELDLAYMRNVSPALGLGLEVVNHNDVVKGNWNNSVLYAGPTLNYRGNRWFAIVNYLPQLSNLRQTAASPHNKVLDEHERAEARVLIGFSF